LLLAASVVAGELYWRFAASLSASGARGE